MARRLHRFRLMRGIALPCLFGALLSVSSCAEPGGPEELDEGGGKADNASSTATSEPLEIETLQRIACEAVALNKVFPTDAERRALMDRCLELVFTVVSKTSSELYQHTGSRQPVTLAMDVAIEDGPTKLEARLFRIYSLDEQRFVWRGTAPSPIDDRGFVAELAKAGTAGLSQDDSLWKFHVFPAEWDTLPKGVYQQIEAELGRINQTDIAPDFQTAALAAQGLVIRRDGRNAGWVVPVDLVMDGGEVVPIRLYLAADGARVAVDPPGVID